MATINFYQLAAAPGTWQPNSLYWIENADGVSADHYITDAAAVPHNVGNATYITDIVMPLINDAVANAYQEVQLVADITARDALTLTANTLVLVQDASADPTVTAGAAMYFWQNATTTWTKISEYESMDVVIDWSAIQNGPTATPAQIDAAVSASHSHSNKAVLDLLSVDGQGDLNYNGTKVGTPEAWTTVNW